MSRQCTALARTVVQDKLFGFTRKQGLLVLAADSRLALDRRPQSQEHGSRINRIGLDFVPQFIIVDQ
jgi:hypothetical protein